MTDGVDQPVVTQAEAQAAAPEMIRVRLNCSSWNRRDPALLGKTAGDVVEVPLDEATEIALESNWVIQVGDGKRTRHD